MTQILLLLLLLLGIGLVIRTFNNWTRLLMVIVIASVIALLYFF